MPTMPPIQNADRYAKYTVTAATTNFAFPFPLFGKSDLKVVVDGTVLDPSAYSVTSASYGNWSLAPNPVTDTVVVLNAAVPDTSGATVSPAVVEIFGSIVPQRTIQATAPFSTFAFNYAFSYLTACLRELYAQFTRALQAPVGESALVLPAKTTRSGQVLGFDSNGDPAAVGDYASISTGAATAVAAAASAAASAAAAQTWNPANYYTKVQCDAQYFPLDGSGVVQGVIYAQSGARFGYSRLAGTNQWTTVELYQPEAAGSSYGVSLMGKFRGLAKVSIDAKDHTDGGAYWRFSVTPPGDDATDRRSVAGYILPDGTLSWSSGISTAGSFVGDGSQLSNIGMVQSKSASYSASTAITAVIPGDSTIPQISEGTQILSVSITPKLTTSKLRVRFFGSFAMGAGSAIAALFVNGVANAVQATSAYVPSTGNGNLAMEYEFSPGSTSAQTIAVRVGPTTGTLYMNNIGNSSYYTLGGVMQTMLVVEEVK